MKPYLLALLLVAIGSPVASASPGKHEPFQVTGSVVHNHDGDSFKLHTEAMGTMEVRMSGADTPESGQAYWKVARDFLKAFVEDKPVTAWCYKRDRYDREVCHVTVGNQDVGLELIRQGLAWFPVRYGAELTPEMRSSYAEAENTSRQRKVGLWAEPEPQPPWECRKLKKSRLKCR